jgi:putative ATP-binding cassette transporter
MADFASLSKTRFLKGAWLITKDYFWKSENWKSGLSMFFGLILFELLYVYILVLFNEWNVGFFNSLQNLDEIQFFKSSRDWFIYVAILIIVFMSKLLLNLWLQLRWRVWMTNKYLEQWLKNKTFYGTKIISKESDNPDQRIADDIKSFTNYSLSLTIGLLGAVVTFISFIGILWSLSGSIKLNIFGHELIINGYLVWVALVYNIISTWLLHTFAKKLAYLNFEQEKREANFRFSLMRIREYADSIALYDSSKFEVNHLKITFSSIIENTIAIIKTLLSINLFRNFYNNAANFFPLVLIAPRLFAKEIQLGEMMQAASAFGRVQDSLSWIIDSYTSIADYRAVTARLTGFIESIDAWEKYNESKKIEFTTGKDIVLDGLQIMLPNNQSLYSIDNTFNNSTLITGISGVGKSTLMRTIAGIWPFAKGKVQMPNAKIMFVAQRSYMPQGTLLDILSYPQSINIDRNEIIQLLKDTKLEKLIDQLDTISEWTRVLSGGEQQKVAFIRVLLAKPEIIFLDEATSAMDNENEKLMYSLLNKYLAKSQIISIGHRDTLKKYHKDIVELKAS